MHPDKLRVAAEFITEDNVIDMSVCLAFHGNTPVMLHKGLFCQVLASVDGIPATCGEIRPKTVYLWRDIVGYYIMRSDSSSKAVVKSLKAVRDMFGPFCHECNSCDHDGWCNECPKFQKKGWKPMNII